MKANVAAAARIALLLVLVVMAWRVVNYRSMYEPGPDSSLFMSIGWHVLNGRVLYSEAQSGPPIVYTLNALALAIGGDGINSVRAMERGVAVVGVGAFFVAVLFAFGRFWLAWITSALFLFHFYRLGVIEDGNVTEEYGAVFLLLGIAGVIVASKSTERRRVVLDILAGTAFALAVLCKEPFLLIVVPWFAFVAWPRNGDWVDARRRSTSFLAGAAAPVLVFLGYLVSHDAWTPWLDTVAVSLAYTADGPQDVNKFVRLFERMRVQMVPLLAGVTAAALGLVSLSRWRSVRSHDGVPLAIVASMVMSLIAVAMGARFYGHYYLFFAPLFGLSCACGIAFVADLVSSNRRWQGVALAAGVGLLAIDAGELKTFARNVSTSAQRWEGHWLSAFVARNSAPGDAIWAPWKPLLYVESRRLAPTKWQSVFDIYFVDTPGSTAADKFTTLRAELEARPPQVIVISPLPGSGPTRGPADDFLRRSGLATWIATHYESAFCTSDGDTDVLLRKGMAHGSAATAASSDSVAMHIGLMSQYVRVDKAQAIACFRLLLSRNPTHYGATYQLAKALDVAGRTDEATVQWRTVLRLARAAFDSTTEREALARLR